MTDTHSERDPLGAQLVRWSWVSASGLGAVVLAVLFYDANSITPADVGYFAQAFLIAASYPLVMLPMFLLKSVVQGRLGRTILSALLALLALMFCAVLLLYANSDLEYALELAWAIALAAAGAYMGANIVQRRLSSQ